MGKEQAIIVGAIHNTISNGTVISGTVTAENDFRVDGTIEGKIICRGKVVVGKTGFIKGDMDCTNAEIVGRVEGNVVVAEVLTLRSSAVVTGDIKISTLVIEPEAKFNGTCTMAAKEAPKK